MFALKRLVPTAALALAASFAACSDAVGPEDVNAGALQTSMTNMTSSFDNASFQSMAQLSFHFPNYAGVAAAQASIPMLPRLAGPNLVGAAQRRLAAARLYASMRANPLALFPANVLGKTLEWDATNHVYVIGTLTGAPASGIRILLYTVNQTTGEPVSTQQLGYLELTDESTPQADQLGVLITLGTTVVADYAITYIETTSSVTIGALGLIRNATGSEQVNFDFDQAFNLQPLTLDVSANLTGNHGGAITVTVLSTATSSTLTTLVRQGDNSLELAVTASGSAGDITGTVKFNDFRVATISGTVDAPVFTAVSGRTLTADEVAALGAIFLEAISVAGEIGDAVFAPGVVVFAN